MCMTRMDWTHRMFWCELVMHPSQGVYAIYHSLFEPEHVREQHIPRNHMLVTRTSESVVRSFQEIVVRV